LNLISGQKIFIKKCFFGIFFMFLALVVNAQTGSVGIGTQTPNSNAVLDVVSTEKGILVPRLTSQQRDILTSNLSVAEKGMLIFNTSLNMFNYWDGQKWMSGGGASGTLWHTGSDSPISMAPINANINDLYLNTSTGEVFKNESAGWIRIASLNVGQIGPQGDIGPVGPQGPQGEK